MGFSPLGLLVSLAVLAPNLLLIPFRPRTPLPRIAPPKILSLLERAGQALCLVVPAVTLPGEVAAGWLAPLLLALAGYYALWIRYLATGRDAAALHRPWWGVPVPMAILPVIAFLAAAGGLGNPWIAAAAGVLAAGHIPVSLLAARSLEDD